MLLVRFALLALNATAVAFLIYRLLRIYELPLSKLIKWSSIAGGIILLLLPVTMIFGFLKPTLAYLVVYPIGIFFFAYLFSLRE